MPPSRRRSGPFTWPVAVATTRWSRAQPVNRDGLICIEYFGAPESVSDDELGSHFTVRALQHREADLNFVLRRIGRLGPNPGCLAVWTFESYLAMEPFQRTSLDDDPYRPEETGIYRWMGKDIL